MSEDREANYRRAKEALDGAGWLFDAFVEAEQRAWMRTAPADREKREQHYHRAHLASEMKAFLEALIGGHEFDEEQARRKEKTKKAKENRRGR